MQYLWNLYDQAELKKRISRVHLSALHHFRCTSDQMRTLLCNWDDLTSEGQITCPTRDDFESHGTFDSDSESAIKLPRVKMSLWNYLTNRTLTLKLFLTSSNWNESWDHWNLTMYLLLKIEWSKYKCSIKWKINSAHSEGKFGTKKWYP